MSDPVTSLLDQAMESERSGRFDDAVALLRQAAAQPQSPLLLDAQLRLGKLLAQVLRRPEEAEAVLSAARDRARAEGAPRQAAIAVNLLALNDRRRDAAAARARLDAEPPFPAPGTPGPEVAQRFHYRGLLAQDGNDPVEAERLLCRAHYLYRAEVHDDAGLAEVCDSLANLLLLRGKVGPALAFARNSLRLKEKLGDRYGQAISHGSMGRAYLLQANYAEAERCFRRDLDLARELNDVVGIGIMLNSLGETALLRRDLEAAERHYRLNLSRQGGRVNAAHARLGLARVHLAAGHVEAAREEAVRLAALLAEPPPPRGLPSALLGLRGAIAARAGGEAVADGEALLRRAVAELRRDGFGLDTLPWLYELRDLSQRLGRTADAVAAMAEALELLSECGADEGVSDVEQWLRRVDSPALTRLALERHLPRHLVENILSGRLTTDRLVRRRPVAVLFCDLRGFTTMSEEMEPEEVVSILNDWFAEATRAVHRHGGIVDKFIGDCVMALFGVSRADGAGDAEQAAADAVRAALALRELLAAHNLRSEALGGRVLQIGVGVHVGEAVVSFIGSHLRLSYTAIGDVVNVASRLESKTRDYTGRDILISQAAEDGQRRHGVAETRYVDLAQLKGHSKMRIYEVLGRRAETR
jgi:class 3 adenylate cyclase